jgi:hypothetical protein
MNVYVVTDSDKNIIGIFYSNLAADIFCENKKGYLVAKHELK